jgi:hypothetical protein
VVKSSIRVRLEVWSGTLIVIAACIIMRFSIPGVMRTLAFVAAILTALWLIVLSIGHARRSDG